MTAVVEDVKLNDVRIKNKKLYWQAIYIAFLNGNKNYVCHS